MKLRLLKRYTEDQYIYIYTSELQLKKIREIKNLVTNMEQNPSWEANKSSATEEIHSILRNP